VELIPPAPARATARPAAEQPGPGLERRQLRLEPLVLPAEDQVPDDPVHVERRRNDAEPGVDLLARRLVERVPAEAAARLEHLAGGRLVERAFEQHEARILDQAAE